ncbi:unnamed protein product [Symbiodinium sp. CCMP2592]|nr:unnamed protein product [Symbiodinium sp. CCMP2592]
MAQSDCFPENFSELSAWDLWDASEQFAGRDGYSREQWFSFWRSALQDRVGAPTQEPCSTLPSPTTTEPAPSDELDGATTEVASTLPASAIDPSSTFPAPPEVPYHEWGTDEWVPTPRASWEEDSWPSQEPWAAEVLSTDGPPSSLPTPTTEEAENFNYVPWNFSQLTEAELWQASAFFEDWLGYDRQEWLDFWVTLRESQGTSATLHTASDGAAGSTTDAPPDPLPSTTSTDSTAVLYRKPRHQQAAIGRVLYLTTSAFSVLSGAKIS